MKEQNRTVRGTTSFEEAWSAPPKVAAEQSFWVCFSRRGTFFMEVQTIASVRYKTLPVDFSRTAERGAKTFLKRKFH